MKARVKVKLNERTQYPGVNAPNRSFFKVNEEIEITDIVNGESIDGNNVWYKLDNGSYVWSGGVEGIASISEEDETSDDISRPVVQPPRRFNYNSEVKGVLSGWRSANSGQIKIGIIDSGSIIHDDLGVTQQDVNRLGKDDLKGHGTHVAGLVNGNGTNWITGFSPTSQVVTINIYDPRFGISPANAELAIRKAIALNCDVINMSLRVFQERHVGLNNEIQNAINNNIIIVAAAGEDEELETKVYFPAKLPNVISVGAFNSNYAESIRSLKSSQVDVVLPNHKLWSTDIASNNFYKNRSGSSMSTAIISGIVAQMIAANSWSKASRFAKIIEEMNDNFDHVSAANYSIYQPYKMKS